MSPAGASYGAYLLPGPLSGDKPANTGEEIASFSEKTGSVLESFQEPPLFSCNSGHPAMTVSRHGREFALFLRILAGAKKAGFFPIKTDIFRKGRF
jgi:hypothetical protein